MTNRRGRGVSIILALGFLFICGSLFLFGVSLMGDHSDNFFGEAFEGDNKIALVRIEGAIMQSDSVVEEIDDWADDKHVKAIILRIDSPGGLVGPSQEIYEAALRARKKKPVVASLADVAASGGYYIAAAANKKLVRDILISTTKGLLPLLRAMLWLKGINRVAGAEPTTSKAASEFLIDMESLKTTVKWRHQNVRLSEVEMENAFESIYATVEQLALIVDKLAGCFAGSRFSLNCFAHVTFNNHNRANHNICYRRRCYGKQLGIDAVPARRKY